MGDHRFPGNVGERLVGKTRRCHSRRNDDKGSDHESSFTVDDIAAGTEKPTRARRLGGIGEAVSAGAGKGAKNVTFPGKSAAIICIIDCSFKAMDTGVKNFVVSGDFFTTRCVARGPLVMGMPDRGP
jgi:hypothetical protein